MEKQVRIETDSCGEIQVPSDVYWGAQTQRSVHNFNIGKETMPLEMIQALALIKKAAAIVNCELGILPNQKKEAICTVCDEILSHQLNDQFPLKVWQTGSGTQSNMNVNEVIANRAIELLGGKLGAKTPIHPNDDVNCSQSSNDVFPTAMHIATRLEIEHRLLPELNRLLEVLESKAIDFHPIIKIGRTHLMDAAPLTLGQEFSGYASQIKHGISALRNTFHHLQELTIGGTAVGTGLNAPKGYAKRIVEVISELTSVPFISAINKFEGLAAHDVFVESSAALKRIACSLMKIANDIRWMASGPRAGLSELFIPANEPGSSIMPGKVNPTQCEAITMIAVQVMGNDTAISIAASQGNFELNVFKPVIIHNMLQSIRLLSDGIRSFIDHCLIGLKANEEKLTQTLGHSLMLATALNPHIGYDQAAKIVKKAYEENLSLKKAASLLNILEEDEFDRLVNPKDMI